MPIEKIFSLENGKAYVGRVAGNIVDEDMLASMEFAAKVKHVKIIMVLGHTDCGAVKGCIDNVKLGNLANLLEKIKPALSVCLKNKKYELSSANKELVNDVATENIKLIIANIRKNSSVLKELEKNGEIKIIGAIYDIESGKVNFLS